jgi:hypothetical protein
LGAKTDESERKRAEAPIMAAGRLLIADLAPGEAQRRAAEAVISGWCETRRLASGNAPIR